MTSDENLVHTKVYASLCLEIEEPQTTPYQNVLAVDLGICNLVATTNAKGNQSLISGRHLLSIQRYANKKVGYLQSIKDKQESLKKRSTKAIRRLKQKQARQVKHLLHIASKQLVWQAKNQNACLVIGDLTNIRNNSPSINKKEIKNKNQKLHSWSFATFTSLLKYKSALAGVRLFQVGERYTSRTCPQCGTVKRSNRQKRGLYKCKCGYVCNADINGAKNILFRFLESPEHVSPLFYDSGVVVRGVDQSIFKFDSSNLNMRRIPVALT
jgi:putative transposase